MICPVCHQEMKQYKEEPSYGQRKGIEYKRRFYRCETDDAWGRTEVPVGPLSEFDKQRAPSLSASSC